MEVIYCAICANDVLYEIMNCFHFKLNNVFLYNTITDYYFKQELQVKCRICGKSVVLDYITLYTCPFIKGPGRVYDTVVHFFSLKKTFRPIIMISASGCGNVQNNDSRSYRTVILSFEVSYS